MQIIIESTNTVPSEKEISELEDKYKIKLPGEYREFIQTINGGTPNHRDDLICIVQWNGQSWADEEEQAGVNYFYHIKTQASENLGLDLESNIHSFVSGMRIPKGTIPIADDAGGNQYIISTNEADYGHVYYWLMDFEQNPDDTTEPNFNNVAFVSESFTQFMNMFELIE